MYDCRLSSYTAIVIIAAILIVPILSTTKVQPIAAVQPTSRFVTADENQYNVVLAADEDDDYWNVYGTPTHNTVGSSVACQFSDATHLYHGQMRFQLNITKGSTIVSAAVTMYDSYDVYAATGKAWRIDEDDVGPLESDSSVPSVDDSESATINYDGSIGWDTHTVTNLVQSQVDLAGWASGQYIGFQFNFTSIDPANVKTWFDYSDSNDYHPFLNVTYEGPALRCKVYDDSTTSYVDETTDANDADPSDVPLLEHWSETPEVNDSIYIGYPDQFRGLTFDIGTQGNGAWTITWEYYNGTSWVALEDVEDETNGFWLEYGDGLDVTWTVPVDWEQMAVDGDTYYWIRARVTVMITVSFQPKADQIHPLEIPPPPQDPPDYELRCKLYNQSDTSYVDETTDANDADPSDVPLLEHWSETPEVNDSIYIGSDGTFYGLVFDIGTQGNGAWTITWEYYNGASWAALEDVEDETRGFWLEYGDGLLVTWTVPVDWEQMAVDGDTYYWIRAKVSSFTTVSFQPKADQIYLIIYPPISDEMLWSLDMALIFLGLIMVPASTLYIVRGGKDELSSDKLFYALVIFFMGCALFIGGIIP